MDFFLNDIIEANISLENNLITKICLFRKKRIEGTILCISLILFLSFPKR
jgi:hypothetical protein